MLREKEAHDDPENHVGCRHSNSERLGMKQISESNRKSKINKDPCLKKKTGKKVPRNGERT